MQTASQEMALTGKFEPMQAAVEKGVSANLCEAIVGLHAGGGERGVELTFSWSPLRGAPLNSVQDVAISPDAIPIISEAARIFRQTETVNNSEVIGVVNRLQHQGGDHGKVTIVGSADGVPRAITLELSGKDHELAQRSYSQRDPISCTGELTREGRSWVLKNPREIWLIQTESEDLEQHWSR
jgi:hypothetical protein